MGPQPPLWNSTLGLSVLPGSGSQDRARREPASVGAFFAGGSRDRFVVGQKPRRKVASFEECYSLRWCRPGVGPRDARLGGGTPASEGALAPYARIDWEGLSSVPPDRERTVVGIPPSVFRVCGRSVGSLSDPS